MKFIGWGPTRAEGFRSTSAQSPAREKVGLRRPLVILSPFIRTPEDKGVTY